MRGLASGCCTAAKSDGNSAAAVELIDTFHERFESREQENPKLSFSLSKLCSPEYTAGGMATETAETAASTSLTPALFKRLFPRPYLDRFLDENLRPDGRPLNGLDSHVSRDVSVNIGTAPLAQ